MSPRDDDLAKLAGLMGWEFTPAIPKERAGVFIIDHRDIIEIAHENSSLAYHLEFAARIAEELVPTVTIASRLIQQDFVEGVLRKCKADTDIAWAAVRAAIAAKGGAT